MFRNLLNTIRFDSFSSILLTNITIKNVTSRETAQPTIMLLSIDILAEMLTVIVNFIPFVRMSNVVCILFCILKDIVNVLTSLSITYLWLFFDEIFIMILLIILIQWSKIYYFIIQWQFNTTDHRVKTENVWYEIG